MGNVAHTPGPWIAYNADNGRVLKHWRVKGGAARDEPTFAVIDSGGKILPEYEAANARLIAAAPDLLAALTQLRDLRNQWRNDDRYSSIDYMDAIDALPWEAAIAAAEGGGE